MLAFNREREREVAIYYFKSLSHFGKQSTKVRAFFILSMRLVHVRDVCVCVWFCCMQFAIKCAPTVVVDVDWIICTNCHWSMKKKLWNGFIMVFKMIHKSRSLSNQFLYNATESDQSDLSYNSRIFMILNHYCDDFSNDQIRILILK